MATNDNKSMYSEASKYYVENHNATDYDYDKSKEREKKYNSSWEKQKVNLNEIIDEFAPAFREREIKSKIVFFGERYNVIADMASGYLRIYDTVLKSYVKLDGTPGKDEETHFKIKKREEM